MRILKTIFKHIFSFIGIFIASSLLSLTVLMALNKLNLISGSVLCIIWLIFSFLASIVIMTLHLIYKKKPKYSKLRLWLYKNYPNIILALLILLCFASSIQSEVIYNLEQAKGFLTMQWGIFAISITIFIFWHVFVAQNLKKQEPNNKPEKIDIKYLEYLHNKNSFYQNIVEKFSSITLIIINALILVFVTGKVYVFNKEFGLITQTVLIFSFYLSTNTLLQLLLDIVSPLWLDKQIMKIKNNVSAQEINNTFDHVVYDEALKRISEEIDNNQHLSDVEKQELLENFQKEVDKMFNKDKVTK